MRNAFAVVDLWLPPPVVGGEQFRSPPGVTRKCTVSGAYCNYLVTTQEYIEFEGKEEGATQEQKWNERYRSLKRRNETDIENSARTGSLLSTGHLTVVHNWEAV